MLDDPFNNICWLSDSYKCSHWLQYPPGTSKVRAYFESRGGKFPETVFYGLQYYLKRYYEGQVVTLQKIDIAEKMWERHFGRKGVFNRKGWLHILEKHAGKLPVEIWAVPEGTAVNTHNVLLTIENTDPECYWLTNYLETLLVQLWYGSTVATQSRGMKRLILNNLIETGNEKDYLYKLHDFGFRGVSSVETAAVGSSAHLVNFRGTDTPVGCVLADLFYHEPDAGSSIPASEHSTITSWGRERELDAMENMLTQYPEGLVACVSDSFDIFRACTEYWGRILKEKILRRDGALIVRPDSGEIPGVLLKCLELLGDAFGTTTNEKGYKVLNPKVRLIQGDGIDFESVGEILEAVKAAGWSGDNLAMGSGGGLLQKVHRDTSKYALKCCSVTVEGEDRDVYKDPVTDPGKSSKKGYFKLVKDLDGYYDTVPLADKRPNELRKVFCNGDILQDYTFTEIRQRADLAI